MVPETTLAGELKNAPQDASPVLTTCKRIVRSHYGSNGAMRMY